MQMMDVADEEIQQLYNKLIKPDEKSYKQHYGKFMLINNIQNI